ncbi:MAG: DUF4435 domain-containing protein [Candidatus Cloacimonetes bacterium]|nr:DUF4435 domain-containing protein [Candidatus Cloacimonadota bacterium]
MSTKIKIPKRGGNDLELELSEATVFVGANGSGKTRLGRWLVKDSSNIQNLRSALQNNGIWISARRVISCPTDVEFKDHVELFKQGSNSSPHMIPYETSDFQLVLNWLASEDNASAVRYRNECKANPNNLTAPPETVLDKFQKIWNGVMSHRKVTIIDTKVKAYASNPDGEYSPTDMSDGERVVFYLIVKCLMAYENAIIVVDEPEIHLHRSIQIHLWKTIQSCLPGRKFIFFTHSIEFAMGYGATIVWLKAFDGKSWDYEILNNPGDDSEIPDELKLQILGSRRPVVFVEGTAGSLDLKLYRSLLLNYLVIPVGGCSEVIKSVDALRKLHPMHHLEIYGIIDADRRGSEDIEKLIKKGIYVLSVAEVENLLCTEEVVRIICDHNSIDFGKQFQEIKDCIFDEFSEKLETQIADHVSADISRKLTDFKARDKDQITGYINKIRQELKNTNVEELWNQKQTEFRKICEARDYQKLLSVFNHKGLKSIVAKKLGHTPEGFESLVSKLAYSSNHNSRYVDALSKYFGGFPMIPTGFNFLSTTAEVTEEHKS